MAAALYAFLSMIYAVLERLYLRLGIPGRPLASLPFAPPPPQHLLHPTSSNLQTLGRQAAPTAILTKYCRPVSGVNIQPEANALLHLQNHRMSRAPALRDTARPRRQLPYVLTSPRPGKKFRNFAAGGQQILPLEANVPLDSQRIPRSTASRFFCRGSRRSAAATSIPICIDVPRAKRKFRNFAAGGQCPARFARNSANSPLNRFWVPVSREPPRSGGDVDYYINFAAGGQRLARLARNSANSPLNRF
ncbi:hypothetical protein C8R43DRAFT_1108368 [Mycena crocata]|nr:hypothetical protein C8R43DRAFT_1108368 [Mycena crocata]